MAATAKQEPWTKGDWCFHEFTLNEVMECKDGVIMEIGDGYFSRHGTNLNYGSYRLSKSTKVTSEAFTKLSDRLHQLQAGSLNHPEFHRYLVDKWHQCCEPSRTPDEREMLVREAQAFVSHIEEQVHSLRGVLVDGVRVVVAQSQVSASSSASSVDGVMSLDPRFLYFALSKCERILESSEGTPAARRLLIRF
jgi:hypothetical protein